MFKRNGSLVKIDLEKFKCKCNYIECPKLPPDFYIEGKEINVHYLYYFTLLEKIFKDWDGTEYITSGYRCERYNYDVGGVPMSVHIFGLATDWGFLNEKETEKFYNFVINKTPELRIGLYKSRHFVHIDSGYLITPQAKKEWRKGARWTG